MIAAPAGLLFLPLTGRNDDLAFIIANGFEKTSSNNRCGWSGIDRHDAVKAEMALGLA